MMKERDVSEVENKNGIAKGGKLTKQTKHIQPKIRG
jgi:hypothetical protein